MLLMFETENYLFSADRRLDEERTIIIASAVPFVIWSWTKSNSHQFSSFLGLRSLWAQSKDPSLYQCRLERIRRTLKCQQDVSTRRWAVTRAPARGSRNAVKNSIRLLSDRLICMIRLLLNWEQSSTGTGLRSCCRLVITIRLVALKGIWRPLTCAGKTFLLKLFIVHR